MLYDIIRNTHEKDSRFTDFGRTTYDYDGAFFPDEDPADYLSRRMTLKVVRLA